MITFNHKSISINIQNPDIKNMYIWLYEELPKNLSGVYVIKSRDGKEIYVGESKNIRKRIEQHLGAKDSAEDSYIKAKLSKSYDYKKYFFTMDIYKCDGIEREIYEIALINHFKTPFNIISNFHEKKPSKHAKKYEKLYENKITYSAYEENARNSKAKPDEYILFSTYCKENKIDEGAGSVQATTFLHFKNQNMEQWVTDLIIRYSLTKEEILEQALKMSKSVGNIPDNNIFADILFDE